MKQQFQQIRCCMTKPPISYAMRTQSVDLKTTATGDIWVRYYFIKKEYGVFRSFAYVCVSV